MRCQGCRGGGSTLRTYCFGVSQGKEIKANVRLRGVRHRYPFVGLPIEHVLVVTRLCWLRKRWKMAALFISARWKTDVGLVTRPETPGFPSKIRLPSVANTTPKSVPRLLTACQGHSRQYHYTVVPMKVYIGRWPRRVCSMA